MKDKTTVKDTSDIAIFARNHRDYLEAAVARNENDPSRFTTFRARSKWKKAQSVLKTDGPLLIYFVPVGSTGDVEYLATLHNIQLNPQRGNKVTETFLGFALEDSEVPHTSNEGLWEQFEKPALTLYVISHCKRTKPFHFSELIKHSDDTPISPDFGYSYCIVYPHCKAVENDFSPGPDEVTNSKRFPEGAVRNVFVNAYERSRAARKKCLDHYGLNCVICGFNFFKAYGEAGRGIIHVHHIKSLAGIGQEYEVDPIRDLRPVCPNCHAVIHSQKEQLTIDQMKELISG
ncbi:MAG TPA: HNH endonuclease [bacterium]|nr:HNH endonuclease [bacterium]HOX85143.1 HNH endonuclease [bacterium]HPG47066.1 HNH endonuclease [bacterium]HPM99346.1 HNH endonuclease [bacterium]